MVVRNKTGSRAGSTDRARSRGCSPASSGSCSKASARPLDSLTDIVDSYLQNELQDAVVEAAFFGDKHLPFGESVGRAALSDCADGKLHDHQRRPGRAMMRRCAVALAIHQEALADARDFAALYVAVERVLGPIYGAGELIVYDVAERIGWRMGLTPDLVYLHAGTRAGARALNPSVRGATLSMADLPDEFRRLSAAQTENLLCIYKAPLQALRRRGALQPV